MLLIPCPWCGPRAETEFHCFGESRAGRPASDSVSEEQWIDYLTQFDNQQGIIEEDWFHQRGCGEWFKLRRDTATHQFID